MHFYPAKTVVHAARPVVPEVVNKKHIPEYSSIVTSTANVVKGPPYGATSKVRSNFPKDQNRKHVSWPDSNNSMHQTTNVKLPEFFHFFHLLQHIHSEEKTSNPKESVDCKVSSWNESRHAWRCENIKALSPVFNVRKPEPHAMTVNNPRNR